MPIKYKTDCICECGEEFIASNYYIARDRIDGVQTETIKATCPKCKKSVSRELEIAPSTTVVKPMLPKLDPTQRRNVRAVWDSTPSDLAEVIEEEKRLRKEREDEKNIT